MWSSVVTSNNDPPIVSDNFLWKSQAASSMAQQLGTKQMRPNGQDLKSSC